MFLSILRVLFGFVVACLAAALTKVAFVTDLATATDEQLAEAGHLALLVATHHALFGAPFALVAAAIGEWLGIRSLLYYLLAGMAISALGWVALYHGEALGQATIANQYAVAAFVLAGLFAGLVYWLLAGRWAGDAPAARDFERPKTTPLTAGDGKATTGG